MCCCISHCKENDKKLHLNPASPFTFTFCFGHSAHALKRCMCFNSTVMCAIPPQHIPNPLIATQCYISDKSAIYRDRQWKYLLEIYCQYIMRAALAQKILFLRFPALIQILCIYTPLVYFPPLHISETSLI